MAGLGYSFLSQGPLIVHRPPDWGKKKKHPLYFCWHNLSRSRFGKEEVWDDFWIFVSDVGEKPGPRYTLRRLYQDKPWGPGNWYWRASLGYSYKTKEDRAHAYRISNKKRCLGEKNRHLKKKYGITLLEYQNILDKQGGVCLICGGKDEHRSLCVDHCHTTRKVRGLLCSVCNSGLGKFRDNPDLLRKAASYLEVI